MFLLSRVAKHSVTRSGTKPRTKKVIPATTPMPTPPTTPSTTLAKRYYDVPIIGVEGVPFASLLSGVGLGLYNAGYQKGFQEGLAKQLTPQSASQDPCVSSVQVKSPSAS